MPFNEVHSAFYLSPPLISLASLDSFPPGEAEGEQKLTPRGVLPGGVRRHIDYFPGLKLSFRLTERLNTRCSGVQSRLSGQK